MFGFFKKKPVPANQPERSINYPPDNAFGLDEFRLCDDEYWSMNITGTRTDIPCGTATVDYVSSMIDTALLVMEGTRTELEVRSLRNFPLPCALAVDHRVLVVATQVPTLSIYVSYVAEELDGAYVNEMTPTLSLYDKHTEIGVDFKPCYRESARLVAALNGLIKDFGAAGCNTEAAGA